MPKKPKKPYPDFPLFYHATGQWAKKIRGRTHYFGTDPAAALELYQEQRDDLQAGRTPRGKRDGELTVRDLANRYLSTKKALLDSGELSPRTWGQYYATCERVVGAFGRNRAVADLRAADFEQLRAEIAKSFGPVALGNEVQRVRGVFKYAWENELIDKPVRFGSVFKKPSRKVLQHARNAAGLRMFEAAELQKIIDAAGQPLRAMILLAINCGFGQTDVATLPLPSLDLEAGWVNFPRPKTAAPRRCPLWPETVAALREAIGIRPAPRDPAAADLVFVTLHGRPWVRVRERGGKPGVPIDAVQQQFGRVLESLGLKRPRVGFYAIRHTHRTAADESKDQPACNLIMGHSDSSMAGQYRERIGDDRLQAVVNVVRAWLWPDRAG